MGGARDPGHRPGVPAYPKPDNWDPIHPPLRVCVHCYGPAKQVYAWGWGVNWVCDHHVNLAKRATGFAGFFRTQAEGEAHYEMLKRIAAAKKRRK